METNTQIQLIQKPEFKHELALLGASIKQRIDDLKLDELAVNDETIQSVKKLRATFNNEKKEVDQNFKDAIAPATTIIDEIKAVKKEHVDAVYSEADTLLKDKISAFEITIKTEKKKAVVDYFNELCLAEKIDFLKFEDLKIEIQLTPTVNNYIDKVYSFVMRVGDDLGLLKSQKYPAEMLTEYKTNGFNVSLAIQAVNTRKEKEELEEQRLKQKEIDRREGLLRGLTMVYHDITNSFNYVGDNSIFITQSEINNLEKEEFTKIFVTLESRIKAAKEASKPTVSAFGVSGSNVTINDNTQCILKTGVNQPLTAPVEVAPIVEEKKIFARFEVSGTREQLLKLGEYMRSSNLVYTNIKS